MDLKVLFFFFPISLFCFPASLALTQGAPNTNEKACIKKVKVSTFNPSTPEAEADGSV